MQVLGAKYDSVESIKNEEQLLHVLENSTYALADLNAAGIVDYPPETEISVASADLPKEAHRLVVVCVI